VELNFPGFSYGEWHSNQFSLTNVFNTLSQLIPIFCTIHLNDGHSVSVQQYVFQILQLCLYATPALTSSGKAENRGAGQSVFQGPLCKFEMKRIVYGKIVSCRLFEELDIDEDW
jgi:hypothetical protein